MAWEAVSEEERGDLSAEPEQAGWYSGNCMPGRGNSMCSEEVCACWGEDIQTSLAKVELGDLVRCDRNQVGLGSRERSPRSEGWASSWLDWPTPKHPHHGCAATV